MKTRIWSVILILLAAMFLQGCNQSQAQSDTESGDKEEEEEIVLVPVEVGESTLQTVYAAYPGTTTLEAEREASIVAKTGGVVLKLLVEEGDFVESGQVVARIEKDRLAIELQRSRADLNRLKQEYERTKELFDKKLVSSDAYEKARFAFEAQEAATDLINLDLSYTDVRAPIGGVISERMIKEGNLVTQNQEIFKVSDFDPLLAILFVPERELPKLAVDQQANLIFDGVGEESFIGEILRISPIVDPQTGTSKVTVAINQPDARLKPGMFGRVSIVYDIHENAVTIPQNAVITEDRGSYVYVHQDGKAKRQTIKTGYVSEGRVEVLEGLVAEQHVITNGKGSVADDTPIEIINAEEFSIETNTVAAQPAPESEASL